MKLNVSRRFADNDKFAGAGATTTTKLFHWTVLEPHASLILAYIFDVNVTRRMGIATELS